MICELISVGTEILLGDILNTNVQYLSRRLADTGVTVTHHCTVGDNPKRLLEALELAFERSDAVILTGGLGPTPDDLTKEVCAEFFGTELLPDSAILEEIRSYFRLKNIPMPPSNEKQALVPKGSTVLENKNGTAPGFIMEKEGRLIIILPGPPKEMIPMYEESVAPYLQGLSGEVIVSHNIRTFGIGESYMSEKVADLLQGSNPTLAPYAKSGEALLRITARAESQKAAEELMAPMIEEIKARLGESIYGIDCEGIEFAVAELLRERGQTAAFAESCTGGLCAKRLTDVPGASECFHCGVVSYSDDIKHKLLGVSEETLSRYSAVSPQCAEEMAKGIRLLSGADYGVSVTGYAGPGDDSLVGTIYITVASESCCETIRLQTGHKGRSCRDYNRHVSASTAFNQLRKAILSGKSSLSI